MGEIADALRRARETGRTAAAAMRRPTRSASAGARDPERTPDRLGAPGAGRRVSIDERKEGPWFARAVAAEPKGPVAERFRHFAIRLHRVLRERRACSVLVTSAMRGEGKTTISCNLALALASVAGDRRIALVEMDLRRPSICAGLGLEPGSGFEQVLAGRTSLSSACLRSQLGTLDIYPAREVSSDPIALLSSPRLAAITRELAGSYDLVIGDCPPTLPVPDVPLIQSHWDAALVVVRLGISRRNAFEEVVKALDAERLLGVFVNEAHGRRHAVYYQSYAEHADKPAGGRAPQEPAGKRS